MSHKQSGGAVLYLLYCYVTWPDKVTEKAEMTPCAMLRGFVKIQASWVTRTYARAGMPQATEEFAEAKLEYAQMHFVYGNNFSSHR